MANFVLKAKGVALPSPVRVRADSETIWSENTGRSSSGKMLGTIIAEKEAFEIEWGILTAAEMKRIRDNTTGDFFTLEITQYGETVSLTVYRSTLSKEELGYIGDGVFYYRAATTSFIQQ